MRGLMRLLLSRRRLRLIRRCGLLQVIQANVLRHERRFRLRRHGDGQLVLLQRLLLRRLVYVVVLLLLLLLLLMVVVVRCRCGCGRGGGGREGSGG